VQAARRRQGRADAQAREGGAVSKATKAGRPLDQSVLLLEADRALSKALDTAMFALPASEGRMLRRTIAALAELLRLERKTDEFRTAKPARAKKLEYVKRHLTQAREGFRQAGEFPGAVDDSLRDLHEIAALRLDSYRGERKLRSLEERGMKKKKAGAKGYSSHIWVVGGAMVNALILARVRPDAAASIVAKCIEPMLPPRKAREEKYEFSGDSLLRWLRARGLLADAPRKQKKRGVI
jgi:hypothetical protein